MSYKLTVYKFRITVHKNHGIWLLIFVSEFHDYVKLRYIEVIASQEFILIVNRYVN